MDIIGCIVRDNVCYQLLQDENKKWYKSIKIGEHSVEYLNPNTYITEYSEITPITEKEMNFLFKGE